MPAPPVPEPIAPGQESVWDYPRPPAIRSSDEEIIVILGGVEICETRTSFRILETGAPTDLLPASFGLRRGFTDAGTRDYVL